MYEWRQLSSICVLCLLGQGGVVTDTYARPRVTCPLNLPAVHLIVAVLVTHQTQASMFRPTKLPPHCDHYPPRMYTTLRVAAVSHVGIATRPSAIAEHHRGPPTHAVDTQCTQPTGRKPTSTTIVLVAMPFRTRCPSVR